MCFKKVLVKKYTHQFSKKSSSSRWNVPKKFTKTIFANFFFRDNFREKLSVSCIQGELLYLAPPPFRSKNWKLLRSRYRMLQMGSNFPNRLNSSVELSCEVWADLKHSRSTFQKNSIFGLKVGVRSIKTHPVVQHYKARACQRLIWHVSGLLLCVGIATCSMFRR